MVKNAPTKDFLRMTKFVFLGNTVFEFIANYFNKFWRRPWAQNLTHFKHGSTDQKTQEDGVRIPLPLIESYVDTFNSN